jgi:hypothetical protein
VIRRAASLFVLCSALLAAACIVTDKIEFEDLVNHPPEVTWFEPTNEQQSSTFNNATLYFTLYIWDPDDRDLATYAAKLFMWIGGGAAEDAIPTDCLVKPLATTDQLEGYETGVQLQVDCSIDLIPYQQALVDQLLLFKVQVSDLGYAQSELPKGARTAEVLWVYEVLQDT